MSYYHLLKISFSIQMVCCLVLINWSYNCESFIEFYIVLLSIFMQMPHLDFRSSIVYWNKVVEVFQLYSSFPCSVFLFKDLNFHINFSLSWPFFLIGKENFMIKYSIIWTEVDTHHYIFVQIHKIYNIKSEF